MRKNPLFLAVSGTLLVAASTLTSTSFGQVSTGGGTSLGGFAGGNTNTGMNNLYNNSSTNNNMQSAQQGQLNAADLGLDTNNFFQGGVQRQGAIGAQRNSVYGYSLIENAQGAGKMSQSTGTGAAAGTNSRSRTNSQTSRRTGSQFGGNNMGLGSGGIGGAGGGMLGGNNRNAQNTKQRPVLRTRISVAPELAQNLTTVQSVNQSPSMIPGTVPQLSNVRVQVNQGTAVVRGRVGGAADRDLAARLMLLDPGVNQVRNEVIVGNRPAAITPVEPVEPIEAEENGRPQN